MTDQCAGPPQRLPNTQRWIPNPTKSLCRSLDQEGGTRRKRNRAKHGVRGKKVEDTEYASSRREADGEDEAPTALTSQGVTLGEDKEGEDSSFGNKGK